MANTLVERIGCGAAGFVSGTIGGSVLGGVGALALRLVEPNLLSMILSAAHNFEYTPDFFKPFVSMGPVTDGFYIWGGVKLGAMLGGPLMALHGFVTRTPGSGDKVYPTRDMTYCSECSCKNQCRQFDENGFHESPCTLYERPDEAI